MGQRMYAHQRVKRAADLGRLRRDRISPAQVQPRRHNTKANASTPSVLKTKGILTITGLACVPFHWWIPGCAFSGSVRNNLLPFEESWVEYRLACEVCERNPTRKTPPKSEEGGLCPPIGCGSGRSMSGCKVSQLPMMPLQSSRWARRRSTAQRG